MHQNSISKRVTITSAGIFVISAFSFTYTHTSNSAILACFVFFVQVHHTFGNCVDIAKSTFDELVSVKHPLQVAARKGHTEILKILLKQPDIQKNATDAFGNTALTYAAMHGQESAVEVKSYCFSFFPLQ